MPAGGALDPCSPADRLADAAITVIARDGFDALSVRAVGRQAHVTGGTVQHHFPTKAELVAGALDRTVRRQGIRIRAATSDDDGPVDQMIAGLCALVPSDSPGREESVVWVAMSAVVAGSDLVAQRRREAVDALHGWLAAHLIEAVDRNEIPARPDTDRTIALLEAALDGVTLQAVAADCADGSIADELAARLAELVHAILTRVR